MSKMCSSHNLSVLEKLCNKLKIAACLLRLSTNCEYNGFEREHYSDELDLLTFCALEIIEKLSVQFKIFDECLRLEKDIEIDKNDYPWLDIVKSVLDDE